MKFLIKTLFILGFLACTLSAFSAFGQTQEYFLVIAKETVNITGKPLQRITINGAIPGPILEFTEGNQAVIHVTNKTSENSSIHWHGLLLPGKMDGVPGFNDFPSIPAGETFTYRFPIRQSGTYWYHAHTMAQEQDGLYGSMIIHPQNQQAENQQKATQHPINQNQADTDYVILLSDFHEDTGEGIMSNLKKSSEYYVYLRRTLGDFFTDVQHQGFSKAWQNAKMWSQMRMSPTDLADINNYTFLMNGKTPKQNWTAIFKPNETVRLRFINASSMSFYDVRIPELKMTLIAADGQDVEPIAIDEFRLGVAETYDVIVKPQATKAYSIVAEPIDRTGFALGTLAPTLGMQGPKPQARPRNLLTAADMGMTNMDMAGMATHSSAHQQTDAGLDHLNHQTKHLNPHATHNQHQAHQAEAKQTKDFATGVPGSGWAKAGTPEGHKALAYADLRYAGIQKDQRPPEREIVIRLGGNMQRYIWTLNGKKYEDAEPIQLNYGERVRLTFINDTMMAHPMHLHGMFVQLENGQPMSKLPNKHTVIIAPGDAYSALLTANEAGEWAFHCHLLYHMMAGMMNKVVVAKLDKEQIPAITTSTTTRPIDAL